MTISMTSRFPRRFLRGSVKTPRIFRGAFVFRGIFAGVLFAGVLLASATAHAQGKPTSVWVESGGNGSFLLKWTGSRSVQARFASKVHGGSYPTYFDVGKFATLPNEQALSSPDAILRGQQWEYTAANGTAVIGRVRFCSGETCGAYVEASQPVITGSPGPPTNFKVTNTATGFTATWNNPAKIGFTGARINYYVFQWRRAGETQGAYNTSNLRTAKLGHGRTKTSHSVTAPDGITLGERYFVRMAAVNRFVTTDLIGTWTHEVSVVPGRAKPNGAPRNLSSSGATKNSLPLSWDLPTNGAQDAITHYLVRHSEGASTSNWVNADGVSTGSTATSWTLSGLKFGTAYSIQVAAVNSRGAGPWSGTLSASTQAITLPTAPANFSITPAAGQLNLQWGAPSSNGGELLGYRYRWSNDGDGSDWESAGGAAGVAIENSAAATSAAISQLASGTTYAVQIAAYNSAGTGAWTSSATARTGAPLAPAGLRATAGSRQASLGWTAPTLNMAISGYRYRWSEDGDNNTWENTGGAAGDEIANSAAVAYTVAGLTNGTTYYFQIAAANGVGTGAWSTSVSARPLAAPGQPGAISAYALSGGLRLGWPAPAERGGATEAELRHQVRWRLGSAAGFAGGDIADLAAGTLTYELTGLTNDSEYVVQVRARTDGGASGWSEIRDTPLSFSLDVDDSGAPDGVDGVLIARYLLGLRGSALTENLTMPDGVNAAAVEAKFPGHLAKLDVDSSGATTAADGIIITRYLLGVTGPALRDRQTSAGNTIVMQKIRAIEP